MLRIQKPTAEKNVDTILKRGGDQITVEQLTQFALW
jgi:Holliday junction DNA helicase RuvA